MLVTVAVATADWPALHGPQRNGASPETGLARAWPAGGPKVLWQTSLGKGYAGPAIRDGEVYLLDRVDDKQDVLRCFDLTTGNPLWSYSYDAPGTLPYNGSRNVPTVDERFIFTVGPFGHLHCIDRRSHAVVWSAHLVDDFKELTIDVPQPAKNRAEKLLRTQLPTWGLTQAPLLYKDMVILAPQTQKVGVVAYDKQTGRIRWKSPYIGRNWFSHVSPMLATLCGVDQVIMLAQPSDPEKSPENAPPANVCGIDANTGQILWKTQTPRPHKIPIPTPLAIGDDRIFITGGYGLGALILKVAHTGSQWSAQWTGTSTAACSHIHTPVLYQGHIYTPSHREHKASAVGLVCLDLDGRVLWQSGPKNQFDYGNLLIADGLIFVMHGRTGELSLIEANPSAYRALAKAKVLKGEDGFVWAPMALSDGKLLVRDQHELKCLDVRNP